MAGGFKLIHPGSIKSNVFHLLSEEWMLITAGDMSSFNSMTASWGAMGYLWNKNVCFCFIRPDRYTFQFIEKSKYFTLSFFEPSFKEELEFIGSTSGRETDKIKKTKLTPVKSQLGSVYFDEAKMVLECKKIYYDDMDPAKFLSPDIIDNYDKKDFHRMYIGEIVHCAVK
jgi:flavin reductase (DIM6/NTAB) family NADH-FMN oxidoreductase RutF